MLVGKVRAKQYYSDDFDRTRNLGVLLHGDGSFSGQGVVYETLDMSALQDYTVGGIIHIVVNNQVPSPSQSQLISLPSNLPMITVRAALSTLRQTTWWHPDLALAVPADQPRQ